MCLNSGMALNVARVGETEGIVAGNAGYCNPRKRHFGADNTDEHHYAKKHHFGDDKDRTQLVKSSVSEASLSRKPSPRGNFEVKHTQNVENVSSLACIFVERGRLFAKQEVGLAYAGPSGHFFTGDRSGLLTVSKWLGEYKDVRSS
ncbi:hypothetical protein TSUD_349220 [Trifolium subterraneum]|uniref:Uncharacterized protein n=1 Tax=Trifolium subterraneum TaxID=3900 RepID=A0A2Z6NY59_TRISU|nr:hypothetical protein TSUD_349220 [Trifolium subterraneum]